MEQHINYQDLDDIDYNSLHCFFIENNKVVAYLRAFYQDESKQIVQTGRVLTIQYGIGLGRDLLEQSLIAIKAKMPCQTICMNAQKQ